MIVPSDDSQPSRSAAAGTIHHHPQASPQHLSVLTLSPVTPPKVKSPARMNPNSSPVRTFNSGVSPSLRKKLKLDDATASRDALRDRICEYKFSQLIINKEKHSEHVAEMYFLQGSGQMPDYPQWRKKPTPTFQSYAQQHALDSENISDRNTEVTVPLAGATPVACSTTLPLAVSQLATSKLHILSIEYDGWGWEHRNFFDFQRENPLTPSNLALLQLESCPILNPI